VNDHHYAIVVGINRYPGISDLTGPRADATQFAEWLGDPNGGALPDANIKKVLATEAEEGGFANARAAKPTNLEIDYALQDIVDALKVQLQADPTSWDASRLYFYAAGHGFAPVGGEAALFLANAEPDALARNIELVEYRRWCTSCAYVREVVLLADCCRTRIRTAVRGFPPQLNECPAPWNGKTSNWMIGFGSDFAKPTYEVTAEPGSDDQARGYFTAALLRGLRGSAARDEAGSLTGETLKGFVTTDVAAQTSTLPFPQNVEITGPSLGDIAFGTAVAPQQWNVTLVLPPGFSGTATIRKDNRDLASSNGSQRWVTPLADGLYEVVGGEFANNGLFKVVGGDLSVQL
jgi:uncharacterized caspase-like protein